jgi:hypothetical protein
MRYTANDRVTCSACNRSFAAVSEYHVNRNRIELTTSVHGKLGGCSGNAHRYNSAGELLGKYVRGEFQETV